jgi:hypothetical protein
MHIKFDFWKSRSSIVNIVVAFDFLFLLIAFKMPLFYFFNIVFGQKLGISYLIKEKARNLLMTRD